MKRSSWAFPFLLAALVAIPPMIAGTPGNQEIEREQLIKQTLAIRYPKIKIVDVQPAPIPSLYEVFTGDSILYTDKAADYLIEGSIFDTRTMDDLTEARLDQRNTIHFDSLPFAQAIKIVKGSGQRRLAIFSDPDCPYCRRLEEELRSVTDITVYVFLLPLPRIHPNAERHARAIWCSADRAKAWTEWMLEKKEPMSDGCVDPIGTLQSLGDRLNVNATPTLYFENGHRFTGGIDAAKLQTRLAKAMKTDTRG